MKPGIFPLANSHIQSEFHCHCFTPGKKVNQKKHGGGEGGEKSGGLVVEEEKEKGKMKHKP